MNPDYFCTLSEANKVRDFCNQHDIGGGAKGEPYPLRFNGGPNQVPTLGEKECYMIEVKNRNCLNAGITYRFIIAPWFSMTTKIDVLRWSVLDATPDES